MCSFIPHKSHQRKTTVFNDKTPVTNKYNESVVKTSHLAHFLINIHGYFYRIKNNYHCILIYTNCG